jgi:hypothetical protein
MARLAGEKGKHTTRVEDEKLNAAERILERNK